MTWDIKFRKTTNLSNEGTAVATWTEDGRGFAVERRIAESGAKSDNSDALTYDEFLDALDAKLAAFKDETAFEVQISAKLTRAANARAGVIK